MSTQPTVNGSSPCVGAPGQEDLQIGAGVQPGLTLVPAQVNGHRRAEDTDIRDGVGSIRSRGDSHNSRCVTSNSTTSPPGAADPCVAWCYFSLLGANSGPSAGGAEAEVRFDPSDVFNRSRALMAALGVTAIFCGVRLDLAAARGPGG